MSKYFHKRIFSLLLVITILLLGAFIFSIFFIKQETQKVLILNKQVLEARSEDVTELAQSLERLDPKIKELESYFIDKDQIVAFLAQVEKLGAQAGIKVEIQNVETIDVSRNKKTEVDGKIATEAVRSSGELSLTMQASGDWANIMAFLLVLEKMNKKVSISGLRLSASVDPDNKIAIWNAIFDIKVLIN